MHLWSSHQWYHIYSRCHFCTERLLLYRTTAVHPTGCQDEQTSKDSPQCHPRSGRNVRFPDYRTLQDANVFSSGSVASLVRFLYLKHLAYVTTDFFVHTANLSIWSLLECGLGISAGSFATLRPLFRRFLQSARDLSHRASVYSRRWSGTARRSSVDTYARIFRHSRYGSDGSSNSSPRKPSYEKDPEMGYPYGFDWACAGHLSQDSRRTPDGSRIGNETTITVGMSPEMREPKKSRTVTWPTGHGWNGGIEREMVFETSSSRYSTDGDTNSTKSTKTEEVSELPKAYMI